MPPRCGWSYTTQRDAISAWRDFWSGIGIQSPSRTNDAGAASERLFMPAVFVSYRRDDAEGEAGRLYNDLVAQFGEDSVFMDVAAIEVGRDFRKAID